MGKQKKIVNIQETINELRNKEDALWLEFNEILRKRLKQEKFLSKLDEEEKEIEDDRCFFEEVKRRIIASVKHERVLTPCWVQSFLGLIPYRQCKKSIDAWYAPRHWYNPRAEQDSKLEKEFEKKN